ncbi:MAG: GTPase [Chloroflexi bacterium]|nr:GTPase [Chloroflexota bacterium]
MTRTKTRVVIMGAAGRDFHNFNVYFRDNPDYQVVAFTATQIPNIEGRIYPPELSGSLYPSGIPIYTESRLSQLIREERIEQVIFAYSDVSHEYVMHIASLVLAHGADFRLMGPDSTMLSSRCPVVAVTAVRTGSGKSQTTRRVVDLIRAGGKRVVAVRHPMPYGDLREQAIQRYASYQDLDRYKCTIEEREEYEPLIDRGVIVYAGVDYEAILRQAEQEADVVVWDGGNNDIPFYRPDLLITVADPLRPGHEIKYHPGETNLRMADVVVINKVDTADAENIHVVRTHIQQVNHEAIVIEAASPIYVEEPDQVRGKRVLVVEDGPTITHGEMAYGAGLVAARRFGAEEIVNPRPHARGSLLNTYDKFAHIGAVLPAMGYGPEQVKELEETINATPCDLVLIATPIDLRRVMRINHPAQRVRYELQEIGRPNLEDVLARLPEAGTAATARG